MKKLFFIILISLSFAITSKAQTNVSYFYVATAVDNSGNESVLSNEVMAIPSANHPNVNLSWTASTSTIAGYNVYRSKVSGTGYVKINTTLITTLVYTDTFSFPSPPTNLKATVP